MFNLLRMWRERRSARERQTAEMMMQILGSVEALRTSLAEEHKMGQIIYDPAGKRFLSCSAYHLVAIRNSIQHAIMFLRGPVTTGVFVQNILGGQGEALAQAPDGVHAPVIPMKPGSLTINPEPDVRQYRLPTAGYSRGGLEDGYPRPG